MGRTKTQRETRDFSIAFVIKTHQNKNNKKHTQKFGEGPGLINLFWGGPVILLLLLFLLLKKSF
jgi:lysophospholipid acyltransferase (LPLAT)-like uncharacterized protein